MFPPIWGTLIHDTLQMIILSYFEPNEDQKLSMNLLLLNVFKNLPCPACRFHATEYFEKHPPDLNSSEKLYQWLTDFHNIINERTGKRSDWTVQEARDSLSERYFTNVRDLSRSQILRSEDHKKIMSLKNDLLLYKDIQTKDEDIINKTNTDNYYVISTFVLTIIMVLLLVFLIVYNFKKH
jgi:hypothetical protein